MSRVYLGWLILPLLIQISTVFASEPLGPIEVVNEMLQKLKKKSSPGVIMDYVDWQGVYQIYPQHKKEKLSNNSPSGLKELYESIYADPAAFGEKVTRAAPPKGRELSADQLKKWQTERQVRAQRATAAWQQKLSSYAQIIGRTTYRILGKEVINDKAIVSVEAESEGKIRKFKIPLVKKENTWLLASLNTPIVK